MGGVNGLILLFVSLCKSPCFEVCQKSVFCPISDKQNVKRILGISVSDKQNVKNRQAKCQKVIYSFMAGAEDSSVTGPLPVFDKGRLNYELIDIIE